MITSQQRSIIYQRCATPVRLVCVIVWRLLEIVWLRLSSDSTDSDTDRKINLSSKITEVLRNVSGLIIAILPYFCQSVFRSTPAQILFMCAQHLCVTDCSVSHRGYQCYSGKTLQFSRRGRNLQLIFILSIYTPLSDSTASWACMQSSAHLSKDQRVPLLKPPG